MMQTLRTMRDALNLLIEEHGPDTTLGVIDPTVEGLAFTDAVTPIIGRKEDGGNVMVVLMPHVELIVLEKEDGAKVPLSEVGELTMYR